MKTSKLTAFQAVLLGVFGALAVGAVAIFAFVTSTGGKSQVGAVKIWGTFDDTIMSAAIRTLAENEPRLGQVTYEKKDPDTYENDLVNALASGAGPDIFIMQDNRAVTDAKKALPPPLAQLNETNFTNAFADGTLVFWDDSGALGIPFVIDPLVLYWNRDMLAANGYSEPVKSWGQLTEYATRISTRDENNSLSRSAIDFGSYDNVPHAKEVLSALIMQAGGNVVGRDPSGKLIPGLAGRVGSQTSTSTENAVRFFTDFANPIKNYYTWNNSMPNGRDAFAAGRLGMYVGLASEFQTIRHLNPNLNFSVAPLPQIKNGKYTVISGDVFALSVSRNTKNPQGAMTVAFLLGTASSEAEFAQALGLAPARRDALNVKQDGEKELFRSQALLVRTWPDPDAVKTNTIFGDMVQATVSGALQLSEAIQHADQQIGVLISQLSS